MKIRNRKFRLGTSRKKFMEKSVTLPNSLPRDWLELLKFSEIVKMNPHKIE